MTQEAKKRSVTLAVIVVAATLLIGQKYGWYSGAGSGASWTLGEPDREAEPRETIYRMLDAARDGDVDAYVSCYSGQMERMLKQSRAEMSDPGFAKYLSERNREIKGIAISEPERLSENEVSIRVEYVYTDRNEAQNFFLERLPEGWKISRVDAAVRVETLVPYGTPVY